jgi:hypothetical protein
MLVLSGAAIAVMGALGMVVSRPTEAPQSMGAGQLVFPDLAGRLQEVASIEVVKADATLTVRRDGAAWVLPSKSAHPVRPERVRELLVGLTELRLTEARTADPNQLARLGLDEPTQPGSTALRLHLLDTDGAPIADLVVGRRRVRTQGHLPEAVYLRRPGENQSWLAEGRLPIDADPQLWLDRNIANLPSGQLLRMEARRTDAEPVVLVRAAGKVNAPLALLTSSDAPALDEIGVDEVSRAFEHLTMLDVQLASALQASPIGEARFAFTHGLGVSVSAIRDGEQLWILLGAEGESQEAQRLAERWRKWAYQVGSWKEKAFLPRIEDLLARDPESSTPRTAVPPPLR